MKYALFGIPVFIVLTVALGWALMANDLAMYSVFAPWRQNIERQVYQETPSFINGNRQALLNQVATITGTTDPAAKAAAIAALRIQVNGLPADFPVPPEVSHVLAQ